MKTAPSTLRRCPSFGGSAIAESVAACEYCNLVHTMQCVLNNDRPLNTPARATGTKWSQPLSIILSTNTGINGYK
ncbi:hypothetical protein LIPSTDRAFT_106170 [Lipomyces starkeyi NRRL Y-11557]|uniref:Uncharacterized protein n=1 Tax=Lipomyces starkeyi NRRL Y-11557 TaxID=675824 RepID=A0A1E3Q2A8_LIPST|nr:hypothetical protein LIPSTDRAFT_106170 [Lipomyces starkeyi NRRL Y-11557]